jgi:diacylglycerol O-acyltransferase / wax synthase
VETLWRLPVGEGAEVLAALVRVAPMDNTMAYIDQASFLGLRALGHGPLIQFTWLYDRPVDIDGLRRFHRNLGAGLLGRRVERSALPFGRHRWVASSGPADLDIAADDRARSEVWAWADDRARLPVDPERGPQWHLGVQPFADGGAAVTLVVSHTTGDALAIAEAMNAAAEGSDTHLDYPRPGSRSRRQALVEDTRQFARSVPEIGRAVAATVRVARSARDDLASSMASASQTTKAGGADTVVAPSVVAFVDTPHWDARAAELNGTSNSLLAAIAARIGHLLGRTGADGLVTLSCPVSERVAGDTRGNALNEARVKADPATVTADLSALRSEMKRQLGALRDTPNELLEPLPLTPFTPRVLVRRLESMVLERGTPIGCSNLGELSPACYRPDGTDAEYLVPRLVEPQITEASLNRMGGQLFVGSCRTAGHVSITAGAWRVGGPNTRASLRGVVAQALTDMGLTGTVE